MTFEGSLPFVLGGQALIGCWLMLVGLAAWPVPGARRLAAFGLAGGAGLVLTAVGFATGGFDSPIASGGFAAAVVGTLGFYFGLGRRRYR